MSELEAALQLSWKQNAESWTTVVREHGIVSRREGTDAAIVAACERAGPGRVLDVGCGEGWLSRALAARGADVLGIDGSDALISSARAAGGGPRYEVLPYDALAASAELARGPWDVIVCNFSLLGEELASPLRALAARLAGDGRLLIQTVHPWTVATGEPPYADGWRTETFSRMTGAFTAPMPWYFRTLSSWVELLTRAGLDLTALHEPTGMSSAMPLSLLLELRSALRPAIIDIVTSGASNDRQL